MADTSTDIPLSELDSLFRADGFTLDAAALEGMAAYLTLLMKWNRVMNLVGASDWRKAARSLIVDSLYLARFMATLDLPPAPRTWDLGAGAGLPGIPLRLVWQQGGYTMVEAREKRALFLRTALAALSLPDTHVARDRVENFFTQQSAADCILSRAFMPWPKLLDLVAPHLAPGGLVILLTLERISPDDAGSLPSGNWTVIDSHAYTVQKQPRYFIALKRPDNAD